MHCQWHNWHVSYQYFSISMQNRLKMCIYSRSSKTWITSVYWHHAMPMAREQQNSVVVIERLLQLMRIRMFNNLNHPQLSHPSISILHMINITLFLLIYLYMYSNSSKTTAICLFYVNFKRTKKNWTLATAELVWGNFSKCIHNRYYFHEYD